jgi:hypothetical protein
MNMSITSMLQKSLGAQLLLDPGKAARVGDRMATEVHCRCEVEAGASDNEIVKQLTLAAKRAHKGRIVTFRGVELYNVDGGKKIAVACVGFI